ncbi:MAG: hypothetical protein AUJ92_15860 [Armatimonadetes bacterium CG2_30_59_28]|nr:MAG: hypothetical protein AUJ92_15860 [Armatimonadetes bacterium CG2_30_59_28]PIU66646.1 MAG: PemK family protein [Armatimonadetes bacterium CG07_land_8_20_14_0_80_59_28]PIX40648.1 MAG: PemK family protein [Armatimonadetes bacterium CG_4_8_14_3_um_filter_58_9]PIY38187.1 MAG: PemK family protein [Armatimonadetes bacterium CG_4_10_14_3_um_filter_59_10]PJB71901.1 MAG: PemK family protein [Armatimonadetes bacterium CG_4_9_14_3_um_filter_58_7]
MLPTLPSRGDIVLAEFPFTDVAESKLRPVLILAPVPGPYPDFLVMFITSESSQAQANLDLVLSSEDPAFSESGLRVTSVFKTLKLATLTASLFRGRLGTLRAELHETLVDRMAQHLKGTSH